jgi:hypothetical protein
MVGMRRPARALAVAAALLAAAVGLRARQAGPAPDAFPGVLDEHPAIQYERRPTTDRVARLAKEIAAGTRTLVRDERSGYLRAVLEALDVPVASQVLVFSKTALQRAYTGPANPRALFYSDAVVVGYIHGAPQLEIAAHDPQQGVIFYTLDQLAAPAFSRNVGCLTCHVSAATLEVPGMLVRSNRVYPDGTPIPRLGFSVVNHTTPHPERWGGWFVTSTGVSPPPYQPLGHLGNLVTELAPGSERPIVSDETLVRWREADYAALGYPSPRSDIANLMVLDHQMHAINLITRINWEARVAVSARREPMATAVVRDLARQLADYLLFADEQGPAVPVEPRPEFAAALAARVPADARGRSCGQLQLTDRLLRHPCSFMLYAEAFDALPLPVRSAVHARMREVLEAADPGPAFAKSSADDRAAVLEILRATKAEWR